MTTIARSAKSKVEYALDHQAAVALLGPRQVGKTTLAHQIGDERNAIYYDLEDPAARAGLESPRLILPQLEDRLVILDEIHLMPELFQSLRGLIDEGRRKGKRTGRFLLLGSASPELLRQSESLAGRITYVDLPPIQVSEVDDDLVTRDRLWLRGGFPDSFLATSDRTSAEWRSQFINTFLAREIAEFGSRIPIETMRNLWTMLAHRQGSPLNSSDLSRSLEVSVRSVNRYIDLLVDLLLVRRLQPYHQNVGKRLVKSPKTYIRDSGLVHTLLGISDLVRLAGHPIAGMSWEGFVIENLINALPWGAVPYFYRTSTGAEIDLLIEFVDGSRWAIEIKRSQAAGVKRGFHEARKDLSPTRAFFVHGGADRFPMRNDVEAITVRGLVEELRSLDPF